MNKKTSPRSEPVSLKWSRLVYSLAGISNPSKSQKRHLRKLWRKGFSFKDASKELQGEFSYE